MIGHSPRVLDRRVGGDVGCALGGRNQTGAVTLLVSMTLLVAVTLLILYTSGSSIVEQRIAANEMRARQAAAAAQAGVDLAIAHMNGGGNFSYQPTESAASWTANNAYLRARYFGTATTMADLPLCSATPAAISCASGTTCVAPPSGTTSAWLVACGWSDDNSARKRIVTLIGKAPAIPANPTNPLVSGSTVAMGGNVTVVNYYNNLTVWSGSSVSNTGSGNGKSAIRKPGSPALASADEVVVEVGNGDTVCNGSNYIICTTTGAVIGPDVIENDMSLANMDSVKFFENFMGYTPNEYQAGVATDIVAGDNPLEISAGGKNYWVEGDATISQSLGENGNPVILVVNGDLTISNASTTIYGIVFVRGTLSMSGGPKVRGAMIVEEGVSGVGGGTIIYDPSNLPGANGPSGYSSLPGTWRDF